MNPSFDGRGLTQWKYSGTIIGGFCVGPVSRLRSIEVGGEKVWEGELNRATSPNPVVISLSDRGDFEWYWGTEDQVLSDWFVAEASEEGHIHPNYLGTAFGILRDFVFGVGVLSPPTIRVAVDREPVQSLITGAAAQLVDGQANPFAVLAEVFTHPLLGLGHPASLFHAPSWQAAADLLVPRAEEVYVSTMIDAQEAARKFGAGLLAMADGWLRTRLGAGAVEAGIFPPPESIVTAMLDRIDYKTSGGSLASTPETWDDVTTRCIVHFKDRAELFKPRSRKYDDPRARQAGLRPKSAEMDLPIVRAEQAQTQANIMGRLQAMPRASHVATVRRARYRTLQAGSHVLLDVDPTPGGAQLFQPCRVVTVTRPMTGSLTVELESVPTLAPVAVVPAVEPGSPVTFEVPAVASSRFFELPPALADGRPAALALLAQRPHPFVTDLYVHYDSLESEGAVYPRLGVSGGYALRGAVAAALTPTAAVVVVDLAGDLDREIIGTSPGGTAARNNELLLVLVGPLITHEAGGEFQYDRLVELASVMAVEVTAPGRVSVTVFRGRLGSPALDLGVGAEAWFVRRDALPWFRHADFEQRAEAADQLWFKLQPATPLQARDLAAVSPVAFRYNSSRSFAPVIAAASPVNDVGQGFVSVALGETLAVNGYVSDADGDLESVSVGLMRAGSEEVYFFREYGGVAGNSYATQVRFPESGMFSIVVRAKDSTGRIQEHIHEVHCAVSLTARCAEPTYIDTKNPVYWTPLAPGSNQVLWYYSHSLVFRCASMASEGGPSSTVKLLTAVVPVGSPLESVSAWTDRPVNVPAYMPGGSEANQVAGSPWHMAETFRIWIKAVDTSATLADSFPLFVDCPVS